MKNTRIYIFLFFCMLMNSLAAQTGSELKRKYEITINRLEFARDVQVSFPNPNAGVLLAEAEKVLQKARMFFESRRFLMANRELDKANRLIINAVRLILTNPIKSQRKKLKERLLIAEKIVSDSRNRKAERSLSKAREHDKKAAAALRKNKYQLALEHIRLGIFMANQAIETAKNQNQNIREKLLEEKKRLDQLMQKAKDAVDNSQNPTASKLFQLAEKRLRKIRQLIDNNNYSQAIDQYHQLTRLLLRIIDIANGAGQKSELSIYEDVVRLDEMIENVSEQISERNLQDNQRVAFLLDQLRTYQQNAHQALEERKFDKTQFNVEMGRRLLERALQIVNRRERLNGSRRLSEELRQLDLLIIEIEKKVGNSGNTEAAYMLNLARNARKRANFLVQRNRNQLALAAIANANRLAFAAERLATEPESFKPEAKQIERRLDMFDKQIDEIEGGQNLPVRYQVLLNEIRKVYQTARESFERGYFNVTEESLSILENLLEKMPQ